MACTILLGHQAIGYIIFGIDWTVRAWQQAGGMPFVICFPPCMHVSWLTLLEYHQQDCWQVPMCAVLRPLSVRLLHVDVCRSRIKLQRGFVHTVLQGQGQRHQPDGTRIVAGIDAERVRQSHGRLSCSMSAIWGMLRRGTGKVSHMPRRLKQTEAAARGS